MKLSIVLLNYQGDPVVYNCIKSIFRNTYSDFEIIFVDNGSTDGSYEKSLELLKSKSNVTIIRNEKNLGFTKGFNIGIKVAKGEYLLLLNNDTILYENALFELIKFMDANPSVGLAEGRIENLLEDSINYSDPRIANFFGILIEAGEHQINPYQFSEINRIFAPVGVWPIVKKSVYFEVGGYDDDFVHVEEIRDLAARVWLYGYEVGYVYNAIVKHIGRLTNVDKNYGKNIAFETYFHATKNQVMFFLKNYSIRTIIKYYFPYITIKSLDLGYTLIRLGKEAFKIKLSGYIYVLRDFDTIMKKRKIINLNRKIDDRSMLKHLEKVNLGTFNKIMKFRFQYDQKTEKWIKTNK